MAILSEDIQCAGSDTRPPMLDKADFASWQQRIRLYCRGKENGVNILKSIDERQFQIGTFRETLAEGNEGALHLGPERPRVYSDLSPEDKDKTYGTIDVKMLLEGSELTKEDRESQLYDDFEHFRQHKGETIHDYYVRFAKLINDMRNIKMTMSRMQLNSKFVNNMLPEWGRFVTAVKLNRGLRDSNYDQLNQATFQDDRVVVQNVQGRQNRGHGNNARGAGTTGYGGAQNRVGNANTRSSKAGQVLQLNAQENRVALDEEQLVFLSGGHDNAVDEDVDEQPVQDLALNVDNVFQADDCNTFDSDVDEAPTVQTMFMANLSSADPVYDEAGPSYDSDILSKVHDHDQYQDAVCEHHEEHEMHDDTTPVPVVQSNVSSVPNDAYMMIYNDMYEPHAQSISKTTRNTIVDNSLTAELATYKEQVELYERRARFELIAVVVNKR
ncbi:hypothetical protein Tco_0152614 [Tanacetum coccineum]